MCTVIVGYKLFPNHPLVIAANRDELLDRPSLPPEIDTNWTYWNENGDVLPDVLAPVDLQRLGTWIGVNGHGVFAALTNRADVVSIPKQVSRGGLVAVAMMDSTAHEAVKRITSIEARRWNGFHLIIGDALNGLYVIRGDGVTGPERPYVQEMIPGTGSGLMIVSNLGIGPDHSPRAEAIMREWHLRRHELQRSAPHRATWDHLMTIHDPQPKPGPEWMKRMASTCIHRPPEDNYGTRSSAYIELSAMRGAYGAEWRYWHRERPEGRHACHGRWDPVRKLPVIG